jgi:non-canonical (house-cleaning) NTP pyrophosphatase
MQIVIGTTSKIKLTAIEEVLSELKGKDNIQFTVLSEDVASQVPDTPFDDETLQGARNRANVLSHFQEPRVLKRPSEMHYFHWNTCHPCSTLFK